MARYIRLAALVALSGVMIIMAGCKTPPKPPAETVAAPAFTPAEGVFKSAQTVAISSSTEGAEIRYTTDSTAPTSTTGTVYTAPVAVTATTTIMAIASKTGLEDSPVVSATFTITGAVAEIRFSPAAGTFDAETRVALSTATEGAQIYYTTDGTEPTPEKGTLYAGPFSVAETRTVKAVGVKKSWDSSPVASAEYVIGTATVTAVEPVTDEEITDARNALARAKEVDADFFDPDTYDTARRLLDEGVDLRASDPTLAREKLSGSTKAANTAFDNSVERAAEVMGANLENRRQRLLGLEADKFRTAEFEQATAGIDETKTLYADKDYAGARARGYQALKEMTDLANALETQIALVKSLKYDTEVLMKELESANAYAAVPDQKDTVGAYYLNGLNAYSGYRLDDAEENFGAAKEAALDTLRIARENKADQEVQKQKAEALQKETMDALIEASKLTVVTEDGTVIKPKNWTDEDFLKEIDSMIQEEQGASDGSSMLMPSGDATAVMADESSLNLLQQARDLWAQGLKEKAAGNYGKAQDYFNEALRYIGIYKSYAVKGVYTVRLIEDRRDCLWRIAEYSDIYGDPYKWPNIWRRNRKLIQNPDLIYPGWQLVIPPD
jgi:nucleoid-associated protein YgaU